MNRLIRVGSRRITLLALLLSIAFIVVVVLRIADLTLNNEFPLGYDARSYVAAARAIREGLSPYDEEQLAQIAIDVVFSKYLYPPVLAVMLLPISTSPILPVTYGLVVLALLSAVVLSGLLSRSVGWRLGFIAVFFFPPTWHTIYLGQVNLLVAALLVLAVYDVDFNRRIRLGIDFALATVLKITPLFTTALMALKGYWRTMVAWILAMVFLMLIILPVVGLDAWFESSTYALRQFWTFPNMVSWTGLLVHHLPDAGEVIALIVSAALLLYTLLRIRKLPPLLVLSAGILLPLLIVRIVWEHHAVIALPALLILWRYSPSTRLIASLSWFAIGMLGGIAMPIALTACWLLSCWPYIGKKSLNASYSRITRAFFGEDKLGDWQLS